jgi:hypothetical protein
MKIFDEMCFQNNLVLDFDIYTMISIKHLCPQYPILHRSWRPYYHTNKASTTIMIAKEKTNMLVTMTYYSIVLKNYCQICQGTKVLSFGQELFVKGSISLNTFFTISVCTRVSFYIDKMNNYFSKNKLNHLIL